MRFFRIIPESFKPKCLTFISIFSPLLVIFVLYYPVFKNPLALTTTILHQDITCIRVEGIVPGAGIGAIFRRNQVALFLADRFHANLTFPRVMSEHDYRVDNFFSTCPPTPDGCTLTQEDLFLNRCPIGDCDCHFRMLKPYLSHLPPYCHVISFKNNGALSLEYSGCYQRVIQRYFGGPNLWPRPYDAIHYRQGDLNHTTGKAFGKRQLAYLMNAMCKSSDRDIIVVTEGEPDVSVCGDRVVLAGNTTMEQALRIMQHAEHVTVGRSSFAILMAELATPKRIFISIVDYDYMRWLRAPKYTVVGNGGQLFHFDDPYILQRAYSSDLQKRTFGQMLNPEVFNLSVPTRRWETEALSI